MAPVSSPMPSSQPIIQQTSLSDSDIFKIANTLKLAIKDEIESMITVQVETKLAPLKQEM
jgi:hypothetical protein